MTIEGPYGCHRPLRQFDSVVLLAGSTGISFTFPLLRDIIEGWKENSQSDTAEQSILSFKAQRGAATRYIRFAWVVKSKSQLGWFSDHLSTVYSEFESLQERLRDVKLELTVYVTCDDSFTEHHKSLLSAMSAPFSSSVQQKGNEHGLVETRSGAQTERRRENALGEKKEMGESTTKVDEHSCNEQKACGPDGTCCCRGTVDENASSEGGSVVCCCCVDAESSQGTSRRSSTIRSPAKEKLLVHPSIKVYSGRPRTRGIIRKALEQAMGESAVVVCGPQGLVANVKHEVCSLSDERAVHKGTGAQGIYLHTESFGY